MRVKELQKTVNVAWSPDKVSPILLAAGTAAQQLDSSFSTESILEVYDINLSNSGYDMVQKGVQSSPHRFHKVIWSPAGIGGAHDKGMIVGGCDGGHLQIYSAAKLLKGEESMIAHQSKHTGPVRALDYNPFQTNLLASAASESEILIWDLNNTSTPMTPGSKTQPFEDVLSVAWNKQVQHILASVFAGRCVIWDLRKNEQIIKLSDSQSRVRWRSVQWNPEVATQLWLASEDDQVPVVQLWDLRYSSAPAKSLQIHTRGILGLSCCPKDPEMMVSCGKDFKILCWNPKSDLPEGEILSEVATTNQWYADITWCPKNPALIASTSLDGIVSLYSLFGNDKIEHQVQNNQKLADSFPGMDQLASVPQPQQPQQKPDRIELKKPPKWLRKPIGASFAFGGKLVSFSNTTPKTIAITQVISEPQLSEQADILDNVLKENNLADYCRQRADQQSNPDNRLLWYFLKSNFEHNPRGEFLNLLGYDVSDMKSKYDNLKSNETVEQLSNNIHDLKVNQEQNNENLFDSIAADFKETTKIQSNKLKPLSLKLGGDSVSQITEAILTGNLEAAVDLCMESGQVAEAIIIANSAGPELLKKTQTRYLANSETYLSNVVSALVNNEWESIVNQCTIDSWKEALVACLTHSVNEFSVLCEKLGERLHNESKQDKSLLKSAILCYICAGSIDKLIVAWKNENKEISGDLNVEQLQELVEIVILLQKGVQQHGKSVEISGNVANIIDTYTKYLVGQGKLYSALTYIGESTDPRLADLRERIYYAIGHKSLPQIKKQTTPHAQQQRNVRSNSSGFVSSPFVPNPIQNSQPWNAPTQQNIFTPSNFNTQLPPTQNLPPTLPPPTNELISQPPRPSSVSGSQGTGASLHRGKHVLDPSVSSNQPAGNSYFNQGYAAVNNNTFVPQSNVGQQNQASFYQPQTQTQSFYSPQQNNFTPFVPQTGPSLPLPPVNNTYDSNYLNNQQQAFPEPPPSLLPREKNPTPPPGWNDPPLMKARSRTSSQSQATDPNQNIATPITHPIFGTQEVNHNLPSQQTNLYGQQQTDYNQSFVSPQRPPQMFTPQNDYNHQQQMAPPSQMFVPPQSNFNTIGGSYMNQPPPEQQFSSTNFLPSMVQDNQNNQWGGLNNTPVQQNQNSQPISKAEIVEAIKKPIPEEYVHIQETFDDLRIRCIQASNNPQTKRKLEDVSRRLDNLYDMLRELRLTPTTLQSLIDLVKLVSTGDYANSIALHTQMISGSDFSQIAGFMPGIKVLLQSAIQMQVYIK